MKKGEGKKKIMRILMLKLNTEKVEGMWWISKEMVLINRIGIQNWRPERKRVFTTHGIPLTIICNKFLVSVS